MLAVIQADTATVEVVTDRSPVLILSVIARDHADQTQRTSASAHVSSIEDVIALHAVLGAHLRAQGVHL